MPVLPAGLLPLRKYEGCLFLFPFPPSPRHSTRKTPMRTTASCVHSASILRLPITRRHARHSPHHCDRIYTQRDVWLTSASSALQMAASSSIPRRVGSSKATTTASVPCPGKRTKGWVAEVQVRVALAFRGQYPILLIWLRSSCRHTAVPRSDCRHHPSRPRRGATTMDPVLLWPGKGRAGAALGRLPARTKHRGNTAALHARGDGWESTGRGTFGRGRLCARLLTLTAQRHSKPAPKCSTTDSAHP